MRMEDLDGPRVKLETIENTLETLKWLGADHDGAMVRQSDDLEPYRRAMRTLAESGLIYACGLSRKEIKKAASAPHADDHELRFPPELRPEDAGTGRFEDEDTNYRLLVEDESIRIDDVYMGPRKLSPAAEVGDFVVWTKRGAPSYQLAVVVDDARQGVTDVVRGDDLLRSAARQALIYRALGRPAPRFWHLPLVLGRDGHRLAKRHGDTRIESYRNLGVAAEKVIGLLAKWSGITDGREEMSIGDFRDRFELDSLSPEPVFLTKDDEAWLRGGL